MLTYSDMNSTSLNTVLSSNAYLLFASRSSCIIIDTSVISNGGSSSRNIAGLAPRSLYVVNRVYKASDIYLYISFYLVFFSSFFILDLNVSSYYSILDISSVTLFSPSGLINYFSLVFILLNIDVSELLLELVIFSFCSRAKNF